jgi:D-cysteine desulfhydrase/L-cysteate sulfo-lyase
MNPSPDQPVELGNLADTPRASLVNCRTPLEPMPNLADACGGARLFVKRDDCTGLAFGGNKVRQLEFYLGAALVQGADTILITSAVQSNYVRTAAAAARKLGMDCHVQLEERVRSDDPLYRRSGNVFLDRLLGATLYSYPDGEDEAGADQRVRDLAAELAQNGNRPYVIPLAPGHPPLGALGYVVAASELLNQLKERNLDVDEIFVASGSGATHSGLLFGLRALGSAIPVTGVCVRRDAGRQTARIRMACDGIASLLGMEPVVGDEDIRLDDTVLAPGYGRINMATSEAILLGARKEGLILDPVYSGKAMAGCIRRARAADEGSSFVFIHTGGTPAIFAYQTVIEQAFADQVPENSSV